MAVVKTRVKFENVPLWTIVLLFLASCVTCHHTPHPLGDIGYWVDMTYDFGSDSVHWPDVHNFELVSELKTFLAAGEDTFWVESNTVCSPEHLGTHVDAPKHFSNTSWPINEIPLSHLVAPGVKIDLTKEAKNDSDYQLTVSRIEEWEAENGRIPLNSILFMYFGWDIRWPSAKDIFNTEEIDNKMSYSFPGLSPEAAEWLVKERSIVALGTDTSSIDPGQEFQFRTHYALYENNVYGMEFVANLSRLPATHFDVFVGPVNFRNGSGAPARLAAFVLKDDAMMTNDGGGFGDQREHRTDKVVVSYASKNVGDWVDLTRVLTPDIPKWPSAKGLNYTEDVAALTPFNTYYEYKCFCMGEHIGTHIDAPRHFNKNGQTVNEIPLDHLMGIPGVKFSLAEKATRDQNAVLTVDDVQEFERKNGPIPMGSLILLEFGWSDKWSSPEQFLGTSVINDPETFNFPGFGDKAVEWLVKERKVVGFGTEGVSLDKGSSRRYLAHRAICGSQLYGLENLGNLDQIPSKDFTVFVMPYKIRGGSGGPARVFVVNQPAYKSPIETVDTDLRSHDAGHSHYPSQPKNVHNPGNKLASSSAGRLQMISIISLCVLHFSASRFSFFN